MLRLDSGDWLEKVDFGPDERILKIGIVHIPGYLNFLHQNHSQGCILINKTIKIHKYMINH